jgi:hypothetical protein
MFGPKANLRLGKACRTAQSAGPWWPDRVCLAGQVRKVGMSANGAQIKAMTAAGFWGAGHGCARIQSREVASAHRHWPIPNCPRGGYCRRTVSSCLC